LEETKNNINAAFANDFNTPKVIADILILISIGNKMMNSKKVTFNDTHNYNVFYLNAILHLLLDNCNKKC
jgi:hypothetical protein